MHRECLPIARRLPTACMTMSLSLPMACMTVAAARERSSVQTAAGGSTRTPTRSRSRQQEPPTSTPQRNFPTRAHGLLKYVKLDGKGFRRRNDHESNEIPMGKYYRPNLSDSRPPSKMRHLETDLSHVGPDGLSQLGPDVVPQARVASSFFAPVTVGPGCADRAVPSTRRAPGTRLIEPGTRLIEPGTRRAPVSMKAICGPPNSSSTTICWC